jgi:hypothetical protein
MSVGAVFAIFLLKLFQNHFIYLFFSCKFLSDCAKQDANIIVNADKDLILYSTCASECYASPTYLYRLFTSESQTIDTNNSSFTGIETQELKISRDFLSQIKTFKTVFEYSGGGGTYTTEKIFKVNQRPINGICEITPNVGLSIMTIFNITCSDWIDYDGYIKHYEYLLSFKDDPKLLSLGYESKQTLLTQLPQGPDYDSYQVTLIIRIIDDLNAISEFKIQNKIKIQPYNLENKSLTIEDALTLNNRALHEGNQQELVKAIYCLAVALNVENYEYKYFHCNLSLNNKKNSFV